MQVELKKARKRYFNLDVMDGLRASTKKKPRSIKARKRTDNLDVMDALRVSFKRGYNKWIVKRIVQVKERKRNVLEHSNLLR